MRYELTDYVWAAIKPFLPNKPRGVPRVNDLSRRSRRLNSYKKRDERYAVLAAHPHVTKRRSHLGP